MLQVVLDHCVSSRWKDKRKGENRFTGSAGPVDGVSSGAAGWSGERSTAPGRDETDFYIVSLCKNCAVAAEPASVWLMTVHRERVARNSVLFLLQI
jgi:hypothetical protein